MKKNVEVNMDLLNKYILEAATSGDQTLLAELGYMACYAKEDPKSFLKEYPNYRKD